MTRQSYYVVNGITLYRLIAAPVLLLLIFTRQPDLFKWLLLVSFFTDAIDGYLARRYKVVSIMGARLDSIADDVTVVAATIGLFVFKPAFIKEVYIWLILLLVLFLIQVTLALARYGKTTSFHTYLAKIAAVCQGAFLILSFFVPAPLYLLFYIAVSITALDLIEETVMILLLPEWKADIKGIYWALKRRRERQPDS